MFIFISNIIFINQISTQNPQIISDRTIKDNFSPPNTAAGLEIFEEPFKVNFGKIWTFFQTNYKSSLTLDIDTYYRYGDSSGTILSDKIYSIDNLYLYKTLLKEELDNYGTFENYLKLRHSPLWYQDSIDVDNYGFVRSINPVGEIFDNTRYLIDNLMPIFLLIENIGDQINNFNIDSIYPKDSIEELFNLVESGKFWDATYGGFYNSNATTYKFTESNLYAVLAMLEIHKIYDQLNLDTTIKDRAYELANSTMSTLINELWDTSNGGFEYYGKRDWTSESGSSYKYLQTNALGIITLLEHWLATGMQNDSIYLEYAKNLFTDMESLWDAGFNAYEYSRDPFWGLSGANTSINLEANALMMSACLKLFEYTGDINYYNRAWQLFDTFETDFYDSSVNAYKTSIDAPVDNNKNFDSNLRLVETYLTAFNVFNSTTLTSEYNVTEQVPDYIFNQDTLNVTSVYAYSKSGLFYNTTTEVFETYNVEYKINDATISYVFKKPNKEIFLTTSNPIIDNSTTLLYNITDSLKLGDGYFLQIIANSSNFRTAYALKNFNVTSGLVDHPISGLPDTLYQGPTVNITIPVNNTRNNDVVLTVSMQGENIINDTQLITFNSLVLTNVTFNLTATLGIDVGQYMLNFTFRDGDVVYLEILETIEIGHSFDYVDFLYEDRTVEGDPTFVSLNVINFLPNNTQSLNFSFYEDSNLVFREEVFLEESEIKYIHFNIYFSGSESHIANATMKISKGETDYYSQSFIVNIIQKYEILSVSFPDIVFQAEVANFILLIQNNQQESELFTLYVNGEKAETNINGLAPGINRITTKVIPTFNPYDFESKSFIFELRDSSGEVLARFYFEVEIQLSPFNLIIGYFLPIAIPIAIILIYKNKELKHRILKR